MNNFDKIVSGAFDLAQTEALKRKNNALTEFHFLWGLIQHPGSVASKHLKKDKKLIIGLLDQEPTLDNVTIDMIKPAPKLSEWITMASSDAIQASKDVISEVNFLRHYKRFFPQLTLNIPDEEEGEVPDFLTDLNQLADKGKLDPVIGRSMEIRKVQEILCRRTKNNPVLVGAPGVGKTAIVEGLAGLIQSGSVPDIIQGKTIYSLNMGALMSGTKYRGEFEKRVDSLLKFLKKRGREGIMFIDELHLIIGAGKTEGSIDAANLLKPALARGELNCIGATTADEYKKYIESDSALERRFHRVKVNEPSKEDSIDILIGLKEKLEIHHGIEITDDAIVAAVYYSDQFISDRFLPDKAIDVIDEGAAGLKLSADSLPPEIAELEALIRSKKILASSNPNTNNIVAEIKELENKYYQMKEKWDKNTLALKRVSQLKSQLDKAQFQFKKAENEGNYEEASKIKYSLIPELEKEISTMDVSWKLTRENIAEVVARATGIPSERIMKAKQESMLSLEPSLNKRVIGQDEALSEIAGTLIAAHAGLSSETRPMGSFLLMGPSGVGKTETAKAVSHYLFHSEKNLIQIDLSEYSEPHSIAKLIGAPPGYVGYEKGGVLTEAIRRSPYTVILFDEIEKAHYDFGDLLLQILDEGKLTDSQGREVNFKNTIIFITSNLPDHTKYLKPEIIGRLDAILYYKKLNEKTMQAILERELNELNTRLTDREIKIRLSRDLRDQILKIGFDDRYGARPLKNTFNRLVIRPLAKQFLLTNELIGKFEADNSYVNFLKPISQIDAESPAGINYIPKG